MNGKKKVLYIDDADGTNGKSDLHGLMQRIFETYMPYPVNVFFATDGIEGIVLARGIKPDLILSEVVLEYATGFDACAILKNDSATREIPLIFLTGRDLPEHKTQGIYLGADDYITKPFKNEDLVQRANALMNGEWRKYEGLYCLETPEENISIIMGEYSQPKPALDCVVAQNGKIIKAQTILDEQLRMIDELKETSRNKGKYGIFKLNDSRVLVGTYLKLKNPALYNCFTADGISFERNPTMGFLRNIAKLDKPVVFLPGYCHSKDALENYRLN